METRYSDQTKSRIYIFFIDHHIYNIQKKHLN